MNLDQYRNCLGTAVEWWDPDPDPDDVYPAGLLGIVTKVGEYEKITISWTDGQIVESSYKSFGGSLVVNPTFQIEAE